MTLNLKDGADEERFRAVYQAHGAMVRGVVYNITGERDLDDLVQETFIKVWRGLDGFRNDSGIKTWIYRIATNTALDHCRKNRLKRTETIVDDLPAPGEGEADAIHRDLVRKGMERLSAGHRAVVTLCIFEGLSLREAASALELPEGTVKSRLFYAKSELLKFFNLSGVLA
ncbi:MAG: sigma-70 family RNA polymerase sigma factor [Nitrospinae bacterium]|nr:sigma-70 family RNA polymerase sigma factor [Nitrospinota bacterium]